MPNKDMITVTYCGKDHPSAIVIDAVIDHLLNIKATIRLDLGNLLGGVARILNHFLDVHLQVVIDGLLSVKAELE